MSWQHKISSALAAREAQGLLRRRVINQHGSDRTVKIIEQITGSHQPDVHQPESSTYLNFAANDYLGLAKNPQIVAAWQAGLHQYGAGSGASGHVSGHTRAHAEFEAQLADWLGYDRALLFISGFSANQAVVQALCGEGDNIVADKLSHASLIEAAMLSPATLRRFAHNDLSALSRVLEKQAIRSSSAGNTLIITEGVFSMDGDLAPLAALQRHADQHSAWLLVDDAHGIGIHGLQGRGSCAQAGIKPDILVVTFGKAWGVGGAAVLCSQVVAEYLLQFSRHLIYSTAMPPAQACALQAALRCVQQADEQRAHLRQLISQFQQGCRDLPFTLQASDTPIQPLILGDNHTAVTLASRLHQHGVWAPAIRPPTVAPGSARLRITLTAAHTPADISHLLTALHTEARQIAALHTKTATEAANV